MGRRAGLWLEDRLKQLSQQTSDSDKAVQKFKSDNNIVNTGRGLINEQQIGEVSTQIILARTQVAEAKARWDRVEEILKGDPSDATITESLRNDVIVKLRQQFLDVARREAELSARYGFKHMAAVNLRNEKNQLLDNIKDELRRIAQSYKSDYEIAKLRETTLKNSLDSLVTQTQTTNQAQVKLRALESAVQTSREVQESFLKKFMEIAQQELFPVTEARIISAAKTPRYKSSPATTRITLASGVLGLFLGLIFALGLEAIDFDLPHPGASRGRARLQGVGHSAGHRPSHIAVSKITCGCAGARRPATWTASRRGPRIAALRCAKSSVAIRRDAASRQARGRNTRRQGDRLLLHQAGRGEEFWWRRISPS